MSDQNNQNKNIDITLERVKTTYESLVKEVNEQQTVLLHQFAKIRAAKTQTLNLERERLETELGKDDPDVAELERRIEVSNLVNAAIDRAVEREARRPTPTAQAWVVYGQVLGPDGLGLSHLRVSVFDKDLVFDDRLGEATTDDEGEFCLVYHCSDFEDLLERNPDIYIKVMDAKGNVLYSSESAIRWESSQVEYFEIRLSQKTTL